jgi:hypothetical protein
MTVVDWSGIAGVAAITMVFYAVRRIPAYVGLSIVLIAGLGILTSVQPPADWWVLMVGLSACAFGLLIVRVMLIRSVSLLMLERIAGVPGDVFNEDIRGRLADMRRCRLVRATPRGNMLTPAGQLVSGLVAAFYALLRIRS